MNLIEVTTKFKNEAQCADYLEQARWGSTLFCLKCGVVGRISKFTTKETKRKRFSKKAGRTVIVPVPSRRLYQCLDCGYQFSVTTGTVFHDSHLPLKLWFMAMAFIVEAKKGISAKQVARHLGMEESYKTVWFLCHRIRKAMKEGGLLTGVVETDETYMTPRKPRKGHPRVKSNTRGVVLGMIERGGRLRLIPVADAKMAIIEPVMRQHISQDAFLQTDKHMTYDVIGRRNFKGHRMIDHIRKYAEGENHTNSIENAFSLLKRGIYGTFHKVSLKHLARYCDEFSFRFNRRAEQSELFDSTLKGLLNEKQLTFKSLTAADQISEP